MSNKAINWAIEQPINGSVKGTLFVLANRADEHGHCFPGHKRVAKDSGYSLATTKKNLKILREKGYIDWKHQPDGTGGITANLYTLLLTTPPPNSSRLPRRKQADPRPSVDGGIASNQLSPPPDSGYKTSIEPSLESSIEPKMSPSAPPTSPKSAVEEQFQEFWRVFADIRGRKPALKQFKKTMKEGADYQAILAGAKSYVASRSRPGAPNPKMAQGWLSDERWMDEEQSSDQIGTSETSKYGF